jgi:uncharacterized protein (DUF1499 family)
MQSNHSTVLKASLLVYLILFADTYTIGVLYSASDVNTQSLAECNSGMPFDPYSPRDHHSPGLIVQLRMAKKILSTKTCACFQSAIGIISPISNSQPDSEHLTKRRGGLMDSNPLKPCPNSPNCVSTLSERDRHKMDPIPYTGSLKEAKGKLILLLRGMREANVINEREDYIHATFTSRFLRFVDDVELWLDDAAKLIHFRSGSRTGYYDFGVNRRRMSVIRTRFVDMENPR